MLIKKADLDTASVSTHSNVTDAKVLIAVAVPDHSWKCVFKVKTDSLIRELQEQTIESYHLDMMAYLNHGLYLPSDGVKSGKFLQEERPISDYPQLLGTLAPMEDVFEIRAPSNESMADDSTGHNIGQDPILLEFLPKVRYVENFPQGEIKFKKVNNKRHRKRFLNCVRDNDIITIMDRLYQGFDPNFQCSHTGSTPLSCAVQLYKPREMILQLVSGGAHLDYRDSNSLTALHQAAISGNYESIKVLLELGMNPNVRDIKGLTPLYHAVSKDVSPECIQLLLYDHAVLGITDDKGRQEIHQACLFGRQAILEQLLIYGADLDALADNHNTPLHMCVLSDNEPCLRYLLKRGAKRTLANSSGQTPYEFAILIGRKNMAQIIESFDSKTIEPICKTPTYNKIRRPTPHGPRVLYESMINQSQILNKSQHHSNGSLMDVRPCLTTTVQATKPVDKFLTKPAEVTLVKPVHIEPAKPKVMIVYCPEQDQTKFQTEPSPKIIINGDKVEENKKNVQNPIINIERKEDTITPTQQQVQSVGRIFYTNFEERQSKPYMKKVFLERSNIGYGFVMQGLAKVGSSNITTQSQRLPLQRIVRIQSNSPAFYAGLAVGDHLLEVNDTDVTNSSHAEVVKLILESQDGVHLKVLSGLNSPTIDVAAKSINRTSFLHTDLRRRLIGRSTSFDVRRQNSVPNLIVSPYTPKFENANLKTQLEEERRSLDQGTDPDNTLISTWNSVSKYRGRNLQQYPTTDSTLPSNQSRLVHLSSSKFSSADDVSRCSTNSTSSDQALSRSKIRDHDPTNEPFGKSITQNEKREQL